MSAVACPIMPSRNDPCPCGSATKYKRCCLVVLHAVTRELRDRDAFLDGLIPWLRSEHAEEVEQAGSHTALLRMLGGITGRSMSMVWTINDYRPADGGPPLILRYAARTEVSEADRAIARGLAAARLDVYRVRSATAGVWLELESLTDSAQVRVAWRDGLEQLDVGELLLARVARATSLPTVWGLGARFAADSERRWRARLATLPQDPADAALALLEFDPDAVAEPLPDSVDLQAVTWSIEDDGAVLEAVEDDDSWQPLGQAMPDGWAFAWPDVAETGAVDLGGWRAQPGEIETARLIVRADRIILLGSDPRLLRAVASHLQASLGGLIVGRDEQLAA
jgi:hypothetical protein